MSTRISAISCYIKKKHYLQVLSSGLVKLTSLKRFLKISYDLDDRIDISSLDQMTAPG